MADERAAKILAAIGGAENVIELEPCITRLRCELQDDSLVDEPALRSLGVHGVVRMGGAVQIVVGPEADTIASDIEDLL
ncbi:PTS glucose/sucrose transporter subunit IIB [Kibdelosporangium philippinense]|uniref:PTS glucose/sucrose transporter subunit IIB n=1 Tax=Kibdelosporangium philippinense TaxID=211113 RepID=A0ABS8ZSI6_9PSEU|nr:PTS glucose/sucrose transporter subunit IIB [Kibdelosporangium philippinense]MCE7010569.1 PTS glucose/sucrose transporter subunit IIB [Kibdelosporangium philippinense]